MRSYLNMDCKGKTIFVTGGSGFLGSEIVKQISTSGGTALVYDNFSSGKKKYVRHYPKVKIIKGDVRNRLVLRKAIGKSEYIINLAALPFIPDSFHYPQEFFDVNTNGTLNLILESINQKKIKNFVHISTSEVYGSAKKSPMDENHPTLPQSTYAVSKGFSLGIDCTEYECNDLGEPIVSIGSLPAEVETGTGDVCISDGCYRLQVSLGRFPEGVVWLMCGISGDDTILSMTSQ